jgi:hypothetical protein
MMRFALGIAGAVVALSAWTEISTAQSVQPCSDPNSCVRIAVGSGAGGPGESVRVALSFAQGPNDGQPGGIDEIATLAVTIGLAGSETGTPLVLADCTLGANGLPNAVRPDPSISAFTVVVQNATCSGGRPHCLCPDPVSGISPDPFINLAIYGPPPTLTPGSTVIQLPPLPSEWLRLLTIDLKIPPAANGTIPLHVFTPWSDSERPPSTAFVSLGDGRAADQTCVPVTNVPPCGGGAPVSQVSIVDGAVIVVVPTSSVTPTGTPTNTPTSTGTSTVTSTATPAEIPTLTAVPSMPPTVTPVPSATPVPPPTCVGDCTGDGHVSVGELLIMVNIALGSTSPESCVPGDANGDGQITVDEILTAVNNGLNGCGGGTSLVVASL